MEKDARELGDAELRRYRIASFNYCETLDEKRECRVRRSGIENRRPTDEVRRVDGAARVDVMARLHHLR